MLLNGDLPNKNEFSEFKDQISYHLLLMMNRLIFLERSVSHPIPIMLSIVGSLSAFYNDSIDMNSPEGRDLAAMHMIVKMPTIAAMTYKYTNLL